MIKIRFYGLIFLFFLGISIVSAQYRIAPVRPVAPSPFGEPARSGQTYARPRTPEKELRHELANLQADYRLLHEDLQKMSFQLRELEDSYRKAVAQNKELQELITAMDMQNIRRQKEWEAKFASLESALHRESSQRSEAMKKMSSNVVNLISDQQKSGSQGQTPLPSSGKWVELKIEAGDTLGKIAKSAGITVKQLKDMNQLKNDRIFVGQVLKVPVP